VEKLGKFGGHFKRDLTHTGGGEGEKEREMSGRVCSGQPTERKHQFRKEPENGRGGTTPVLSGRPSVRKQRRRRKVKIYLVGQRTDNVSEKRGRENYPPPGKRGRGTHRGDHVKVSNYSKNSEKNHRETYR